jgi:DNA helicase HerA-like ATPase
VIEQIMKNLWFSGAQTYTPSRKVKNQKKKAIAPKKVGAPVPILEIGHEVLTGIPFKIDSNKFISSGERDVILASSGMGKSYLMGVILEELLEKSNQVVFIIDPEGEWHTLKQRYDNDQRAFKVVGKAGHNSFPVDLRFAHDATEEDIVNAVNAFEIKVAPMVRAMIAGAVSCVFDLSRFGDREALEAYTVIAEAIFKGENNLREEEEGSDSACRKVKLFIDESHVFAPQNPKGDHESVALEVTKKIAKRGRKRNIHLTVATQRPTAISKDVISQGNRFWLGGIQSKHDYDANKSVYQQAGLRLEDVQSLQPGNFCYFGAGDKAIIRSRKRYCKHGGETKQESTKPVLSKKEADELLAGFFK